MANAIEVSDFLSNNPEQIAEVAKAIGRGARRKVFDAIYHHKAKVKSVGEIAEKTHLSRMRVLQEGRHLSRKGIVRQTRKNGETAYEKIDSFHAHKGQILRLASDPKKLADLPTKRKPWSSIPSSVTIPSAGARVSRITIDDIRSFARVKKIKRGGSLPSSVTEKHFKSGVQRIIGEPGDFKDWGGEQSDLYTTRLRLNRRRLAAALAFKGPGEKGKLVPGRMGKNGDQALRLFQEDADIFLVQHWREIDPRVLQLMRNLAVAKSVTAGQQVWYGVIDGVDSERLRLAYANYFSEKASRK